MCTVKYPGLNVLTLIAIERSLLKEITADENYYGV